MTEHIINSIKEAQLVLIGIGEEFDLKKLIRQDKRYQEVIEGLANEWLIPFVEKAFLEKAGNEYLEAYKQLAHCLQDKNYFIVSLCQDGFIRLSGLDTVRMVEPCGTYDKLQCSEGCSRDLYNVPEELKEQVNLWLQGEISETEIERPVCLGCGKPLEFNLVETANYNEDGYLEKWQKYKLWLQGTVNKKLCVLELGVGMKYPTVIRWPFEKVVYFNQKAELFRVHSKLYQMTEEIKDKGFGICSKPVDFVKELYNKF